MGYRSNVRLLISKEGYKMLKELCESSSDKSVRDMTLKSDTYEEVKEGVLVGWSYVKWYSNYKDVSSVMGILKELDMIVEESPDLLEEYYYKMIEIGEDNATIVHTNDYDNEYTDEFYIECDFSM